MQLTIYRLLKYHRYAEALTSSGNGVGSSDSPGRTTGCRKYTAAQMFWFTSRYRGMKANGLM